MTENNCVHLQSTSTAPDVSFTVALKSSQSKVRDQRTTPVLPEGEIKQIALTDSRMFFLSVSLSLNLDYTTMRDLSW